MSQNKKTTEDIIYEIKADTQMIENKIDDLNKKLNRLFWVILIAFLGMGLILLGK